MDLKMESLMVMENWRALGMVKEHLMVLKMDSWMVSLMVMEHWRVLRRVIEHLVVLKMKMEHLMEWKMES
jgi:hypothetical protein